LRDVDDAVPGPDVSAFVSVLTVVVLIAFIAGVGYAAIAIPAQTELQAEIPQAVRGRVFGILNMLVSIGSFLPIIVVGYISDVIGTMPVVLVAATSIMLVGITSIVRRRDPSPTPVPVDAQPGAGEPVEAQPGAVEPVEAQPGAVEPVHAQPGHVEPVAPGAGEPVTPGPSPDEP
jgi:MFS family permease